MIPDRLEDPDPRTATEGRQFPWQRNDGMVVTAPVRFCEASVKTTLVTRNVVVKGHRTSFRLEVELWDALFEICDREKKNLNQLCTMIDTRRDTATLTSAARTYIVRYFRWPQEWSGVAPVNGRSTWDG